MADEIDATIKGLTFKAKKRKKRKKKINKNTKDLLTGANGVVGTGITDNPQAMGQGLSDSQFFTSYTNLEGPYGAKA